MMYLAPVIVPAWQNHNADPVSLQDERKNSEKKPITTDRFYSCPHSQCKKHFKRHDHLRRQLSVHTDGDFKARIMDKPMAMQAHGSEMAIVDLMALESIDPKVFAGWNHPAFEEDEISVNPSMLNLRSDPTAFRTF